MSLADLIERLSHLYDYVRVVDPPGYRPAPGRDPRGERGEKPRQAGGRPLIVLVDPTPDREKLAWRLAELTDCHVLPADSSYVAGVSLTALALAANPNDRLAAEYCPDLPLPSVVIVEAYHPLRIDDNPVSRRPPREAREVVEWLAGGTATLSPRRIPYLLYTADENMLARCRQEWTDYFQLGLERNLLSASDVGLAQAVTLLLKASAGGTAASRDAITTTPGT